MAALIVAPTAERIHQAAASPARANCIRDGLAISILGEDLFGVVGIQLPFERNPRAVPMGNGHGHSYLHAATGWRVHCLRPADSDLLVNERDFAQHFLAFTFPAGSVSAFIPPSCAAFMNAAIREVFRSTNALRAASRHLMKQNVLYLGDLVRMSRDELIERLGDYGHLVAAIEFKMEELGLRLGALADWWRRPADYYQQTY